jgi:3-phosphoshikimate 1-carboxyvinyltransferase
VIKALCGWGFEIKDLSQADDTTHLEQALTLDNRHIFAGDGGTTFRFLTALLCTKPGEWHLSGSAALTERPVGVLVDALRSLGARIEYVGKTGFPPLKIKGQKLHGGEIVIQADQSSQFLSALLMIAPVMDRGLQMTLRGKVVSRSYIGMTLKLMKYFGVEHHWEGQHIVIQPQHYQPRDIVIEPDWTAASYFYEMAALCEAGSLQLNGLKPSDLQGDSALPEIMSKLAVITEFNKQGTLIYPGAGPVHHDLRFDLTNNPDLTQTIAFACAALGREASFDGIDHLRIKETDRLQAIQWELGKIGFGFDRHNGVWRVQRKENPVKLLQFNTYGDHRMAMAAAPLAVRFGQVTIDRPEVVSKSFPDFWNQLRRIGFEIERR